MGYPELYQPNILEGLEMLLTSTRCIRHQQAVYRSNYHICFGFLQCGAYSASSCSLAKMLEIRLILPRLESLALRGSEGLLIWIP